VFAHWELIVLAVLALALFGGGMLPKLARTAGRTVREVKSVKDEVLSLDAPDQKPPANKPTSAP
jgi:Sec-independent protein translocase protein TatA